MYGGFSQADYKRLEVFWATNGWEKWAATHNVTPENRYIKARITFSGSTSFDIVNLVAVKDSSKPWDYTHSFSSLTELKAADLVEEHEWEERAGATPDTLPTRKKLGVEKITLRR
jgi:hypothetical protein